jgi:signal transduction histidine kinase
VNPGSTIAILLVEDSDAAATHTRNMLTEGRGRLFDPEPVLATKLADATKHLADAAFDVVLLDLTLQDGTELNTFSKLHSYAPAVPLVILSGLEDEDLAIEAVRKGADDYLIKSEVSCNILKRSILYAIERKQIQREMADHRVHLEELIEVRTADLKTAYECLSKEVEARKTAEKDLAQKVRELQGASRELEHFVNLAAHDLQQPLRMVSIHTELLHKSYADRMGPDADELIHNVLAGARKMHSLIDGLLIYAGIGMGRRRLVPTDLGVALAEAVTTLHSLIVSNDATVLNGPMPIIRVDREMIVRLFLNLIENAIRFRRDEPPQVHISAESKGSTWVFSVGDNGIGIHPRDHDRIFRIFQRLNRGDTDESTGIGLAICRRIVECHNGKIWVDSQMNKGSVFRFTLPVSMEAAWLS